MQSADQSRAFVVQDPRQAAAFQNQLRARLLVTCAGAERSLSELHRVLGQPLAKLHYHADRLLAVGLLVVSRSEPRTGRPIRFYRAVADSFLVSQQSLPALPSEAWSAELRGSLELELGRAGDVSLRYEPGRTDGTMKVQLVRPEPVAPPRGLDRWRLLRLSPRQRGVLAAELTEVLERHAGIEPEVGAESYIAHVALAPRLNNST